MQLWQILLIILIILVIILVVLYFLGKRLEKKQVEQQEQIEAAKQNVTMLVIDKKRLKITESGLPQMVIDQTPWYARRSKLPIVKAKIGPRVMTMVADEAIFDIIPVKKEVKATISGIYITDVRALRGSLPPRPTKQTWRQKLSARLLKTRNEAISQAQAAEGKKKKK